MIKSLYEPFRHWSDKGSVYIISDPHFDDSDCKIMNPEWPSAQQYMNNIKSQLSKVDTLICLGDVGNPIYLSQLNCYKILIKGNHDSGNDNYKRKCMTSSLPPSEFMKSYPGWRPMYKEDNQSLYNYSNFLFDEVYEGPLFISEKILLSHEPVSLPFGVNIHGHCHNGIPFENHGSFCEYNVAADVVNFGLINLGELIRRGIGGETIHRVCIDYATENKRYKNNV